jgi:peptide/nickel transport system substrate-binding protein
MHPGTTGNWNGNWGNYVNDAADDLIEAIPIETDPDQLKADFTELTRIYLTDIPSFTLMYRPQAFHTVNESIWTHFPHAGDASSPPVPPLDLTDGWSIAGLSQFDERYTEKWCAGRAAPALHTNFREHSRLRNY